MKSTCLGLLLLAMLAGLPAALRGEDISFRLEGISQCISAVPAPGPVALDGKLDEWDLSGEILSYDHADIAEKEHARLALMYDRENLYVGMYCRDATPLQNMVDAHIDWRGEKAGSNTWGWRGDALQLRICVDPAQGYPLPAQCVADTLCHLTLWYSTPRKEPQLNIERGMDFHDSQTYFGADSGLAFALAPGGYIMEAKISWQRLRAPSPPQPGSRLPISCQFHFGEGSTLKTAIYDLTTRSTFPYQTAEFWGQVIFEPTGKLDRRRESIPDPLVVEKTLSFPLTLPDAAQVGLSIFNTKGQLVRTLLTGEARKEGKGTERWDGLNNAGAVLPVGRYGYKAVTHGEIKLESSLAWPDTEPAHAEAPVPEAGDVAVAGERVFLLWSAPDAGYNLVACTLDGKKLWGANLGRVFENRPSAIAADAKLVYLARGGEIVAFDAASGQPAAFAVNQRSIPVSLNSISALACQAGHLYALSPGKLADVALDKARVAHTLAVDKKATALAVLPNGNGLVVAMPDGLYRINPATGKDTLVFTATWSDPSAMAITPDGKTLYVTDRKTSVQTIRIFSFPGGLPIGAIGKPGGRPARGAFDPDGLCGPGGIALDAQGRVWVAEHDGTPRRLSLWLPDGGHGKLCAEFFGMSEYPPLMGMDAVKGEHLYARNARWTVDYAANTLKREAPVPVSFLWRHPEYLLTAGHTAQVREVQDRLYFFSDSGVWELRSAGANTTTSRYDVSWVGVRYWNDLNGDGKTQALEITPDAPALTVVGTMGADKTPVVEDIPWSGSSSFKQDVKAWQENWPVCLAFANAQPKFSDRCLGGALTWLPGTPKRLYVLDGGLSSYATSGKRQWNYTPSTGQPFLTGSILGMLDTGDGKNKMEALVVTTAHGCRLFTDDGLVITDLPAAWNADSQLAVFHSPSNKKCYLLADGHPGGFWELTGLTTCKRLTGTIEITDADAQSAAKALARAERVRNGRKDAP